MKLSPTSKRMTISIGLLFTVLLLIGLCVIFFVYEFEPPLNFGLGLLVGCALSAVKVVMLERAINRSFELEGPKAKNYATLQSLLRYGLTIAVLAAAIYFNSIFGLFGIILGVLSLQFSAYITNFWETKITPNE